MERAMERALALSMYTMYVYSCTKFSMYRSRETAVCTHTTAVYTVQLCNAEEPLEY